MGETWLDAGDLKQAEPCYKKALLYGEKADDPLLIAAAKSGLGALYLEKGETTKALQYLQEADVVIGEILAEHEDSTDDNTRHAERSEASVPAPELTDREASVLPLLAQGLTSKEIASRLFLTEQTIKWYRMRLIEKFEVRNTAELISKARETGML